MEITSPLMAARIMYSNKTVFHALQMRTPNRKELFRLMILLWLIQGPRTGDALEVEAGGERGGGRRDDGNHLRRRVLSGECQNRSIVMRAHVPTTAARPSVCACLLKACRTLVRACAALVVLLRDCVVRALVVRLCMPVRAEEKAHSGQSGRSGRTPIKEL
jgi:hypothetical protein